jgi:cytosine/adenosine deaminase-related metal-dependent hydrolase
MIQVEQNHQELVLHGARVAWQPRRSTRASIEITLGRITGFRNEASFSKVKSTASDIDLSGFLVMPGLINAHDHLEFSLFPRLANPPYPNYIDWGTDIHNTFPDLIAKHRAVPKEMRLWWGGIRNLLAGVTTVGHHNPLWPELQRMDFPLRVIQNYGWGHSLALGGDLPAAQSATLPGAPFIIHACEGIDEVARAELSGLDRLGLLDSRTVLVHGLAIDAKGVSLIERRQASLIVCPSSNSFLFDQVPDTSVLGKISNLALGNDSPLTAQGDLLDEIRFVISECDVSPQTVYRMVTDYPAYILRLNDTQGSLSLNGVADLFAVRDTGQDAVDKLASLSMQDVELVVIAGKVQLASEFMLDRINPSDRQGLEPLWIDGTARWLRAPIQRLLRETEAVLGKDNVRLSSRRMGGRSSTEAPVDPRQHESRLTQTVSHDCTAKRSYP